MTAYPQSMKTKVFELRQKGYTHASISKKLGVSVPSIGVWIRAAVKKHPRKYKALVRVKRK